MRAPRAHAWLHRMPIVVNLLPPLPRCSVRLVPAAHVVIGR